MQPQVPVLACYARNSEPTAARVSQEARKIAKSRLTHLNSAETLYAGRFSPHAMFVRSGHLSSNSERDSARPILAVPCLIPLHGSRAGLESTLKLSCT